MTEKRTSIFSYVLLTMTLTHTFTHVFQHIHLAIFPIIRTEFQLSILQLGIIAAIPSLFQTLFYIPMGLFSDRFGSKKMILVSSVLATLGSLMASQTINSAMLIFAVSLVYINTTLYHPAAYSLVTRLFRHPDRPKALGIHTVPEEPSA